MRTLQDIRAFNKNKNLVSMSNFEARITHMRTARIWNPGKIVGYTKSQNLNPKPDRSNEHHASGQPTPFPRASPQQ